MTKNVTTTNIYHNNLSDYTSTTDIYATDTITISSITGTGATGTSYNWLGSNGTSQLDWSNLTVSSTPAVSTSISQKGLLELHGNEADIKINGRSLTDAIKELEQRLNILVVNPELEKEWDELRELGDRYRELEKQCKEKGEMWKKLKQMPPPEVK